MKPLLLIILALLSASVFGQSKLKITNLNNQRSYFIKPHHKFKVKFTKGKLYSKFRFRKASGDKIYAVKKVDGYFDKDTVFLTTDIYKLRVQPKSLFKTTSKIIASTLLAIPSIVLIATFGKADMPAFVYGELIVLFGGFAAVSPQVTYGLGERIWLGFDKGLERGDNLGIMVVDDEEK